MSKEEFLKTSHKIIGLNVKRLKEERKLTKLELFLL